MKEDRKGRETEKGAVDWARRNREQTVFEGRTPARENGLQGWEKFKGLVCTGR